MADIRTRNRHHEPRKQPSQARSRATVDALVEAAAQLFDQLGYADTTTDFIAERAGTSIGTLYQYFPDKDALLVATFETHLDEVESVFRALIELLDADVALDAFVQRAVHDMFELHRGRPTLHRIYIEEAPMPARVFQRYATLERPLRHAWVAHLRRAPRLETSLSTAIEADLELAVGMATSVLEALAHRCTLYPPADTPAARLEEEAALLILGYLRHRR